MCCERLVCAACAGVVADGSCAVCRITRGQLHASGLLGLPGQVVVLLGVLLALLTLLALSAG